MNLLELMLKEEIEWPVAAKFAAQDGDMWLAYYDATSAPFMYDRTMAWSSTGGLIQKAMKKLDLLSEDWSTRIITREEYQAAGGKIAADAVCFTPFVSVEDAATAKQSPPKGSGRQILDMVLADLTNRALEGKEKYGEPLKARNGRNSLWDAYQEALDLAMYLRQAIEEQR